MQYRLFCSILCAGLILEAAPVLSHEFWIEPEKYQVNSGETVVAKLRNGQEFYGAEQPYLDHRIARFEVLQGGTTLPYIGRMGDMPAFSGDPMPDGLAVLIHQTRPQTITYDSWEEFQAFVDHKAFGDIQTQHRTRGLADSGFVEQYTRYAKALVAIGDGTGLDQAAGLETEIVALANPYTDDMTGGLPIRVLYQGNPRPNAQVEVFAKAPDGSVTITTRLTDSQGKAIVPLAPGHIYLLDAVVLRPAPDGADYVWESLWAALTFAVPAR
ncbi:DUF4198 domain-containing protein [Leisingera sp. JC1]|uniref:DUF4198 domain-containing protein n=1 Tax=Leisingera sp. JC1 TaxID=1855282 RepID=UPI0008038347|nr:DUF4198 domain-containing protein [Leisingera sp. JC1]OBY27364.1 hypothetical protein A9D60_03190 [Leisingera sp. JC1]